MSLSGFQESGNTSQAEFGLGDVSSSHPGGLRHTHVQKYTQELRDPAIKLMEMWRGV